MTTNTMTVVVLDTDVVRRALIECALPPQAEARFAVHPDEVPDSDVILIGPRPGTALEHACRALDERMAIILCDERYVDAELARREVAAVGAAGFVAPPYAREALEEVLNEAVSKRRLATATPSAPRDASPTRRSDPPATPEKLWELFRERVDVIYRNLDRLDHYQVLETSQQSSGPQIKSAYQLRLMEFHPDRFASNPSEEFRRKLYEITKAVTEAFRVLSDPAARAAYDVGRRPRERTQTGIGIRAPRKRE
jgi:hypothetical protein